MHVWSHPFDIHLATNNIIEWPKFLLRVWRLSMTGNFDIVGYGSCVSPSKPGASELICETWKSRSTPMDESKSFFLNGPPISSGSDLMNLDNRKGVVSQSSGRIHIYCETILKNFKHLSIMT